MEHNSDGFWYTEFEFPLWSLFFNGFQIFIYKFRIFSSWRISYGPKNRSIVCKKEHATWYIFSNVVNIN